MATRRVLVKAPMSWSMSSNHFLSGSTATQPVKAIISRARTYHSHDHPPPPSKFSPTESLILSSAYKFIPTHGFTLSALALAAKQAGYLDASVNLFPDGAASLVDWHLHVQKNALAATADAFWGGNQRSEGRVAESGSGKGPGVWGKVKELTWERLMGNTEIIGRWQEALAILAQPSNVPLAIRSLTELSDEIWYLAGDVSVDTSWYTKRASLSAIYASSELFMTTDGSEGYRDTREFMERRFEDGRIVGGALGNAGEWLAFQGRAAVNVARSKGMRI